MMHELLTSSANQRTALPRQFSYDPKSCHFARAGDTIKSPLETIAIKFSSADLPAANSPKDTLMATTGDLQPRWSKFDTLFSDEVASYTSSHNKTVTKSNRQENIRVFTTDHSPTDSRSYQHPWCVPVPVWWTKVAAWCHCWTSLCQDNIKTCYFPTNRRELLDFRQHYLSLAPQIYLWIENLITTFQ